MRLTVFAAYSLFLCELLFDNQCSNNVFNEDFLIANMNIFLCANIAVWIALLCTGIYTLNSVFVVVLNNFNVFTRPPPQSFGFPGDAVCLSVCSFVRLSLPLNNSHQ